MNASLFILRLEKCPRCGRNGLIHGHFHEGKNDRYGWLGVKCIKCGYEKRDEKETNKMISEFKALENGEKRK